MKRLIIAISIVLLMYSPLVANENIHRTMDIPNESGELSNGTFIYKDVAYKQIWSTITAGDTVQMWNDIQLLKAKGIKKVVIYMSSGGGSAFAGLGLADQIEIAQRGGFDMECHASGIIASAMVPVYSVCNKRFASPGTIFMVHEASLFKYFSNETKSDIRSQNELMELLTERYMDKLASHSKLTKEEWLAKEKETTWFCVEKGVEWGLVDVIE